MEILKKIIITNKKRPILLNTEPRNDSSLSKTNQTCNNNNINKNINYISSYVNIQNSKMKLKKNIPKGTLNISFCKTGVNSDKNNNNQVNKECKFISYIDLGNNKIKKYSKNKKELSQETKYNYTQKKDLIINNNITNNISNNITNIILANNKKSNRVDENNSLLNKANEKNNNLTQRLQMQKRIIKNNKLERFSYNQIKNYKKNLTSRNSKNIDKIQDIKINSIKVITKNCKNKEKGKEDKIKIITERNKNNINTYYSSYINSCSNLNLNNKTYNSNIPMKNKSKKSLIKFKNITNNIELDINTKNIKLKKNYLQKLKENGACNSNSKKNFINFCPSMKHYEEFLPLNSNRNKTKADNDKNKIKNIKNNFYHYFKTKQNNKYIFTKIQKQYKPELNINLNDLKAFNQMKLLFDSRMTNGNMNKSFCDKNINSNFFINSSVTLRGNNKENNFKRINNTLISSNSKFKQDNKNNQKKTNIFKYKNKNDLMYNIYKNYKTDRSIGNNNYANNTYNNDESSNINIINIINNFNQKNVSCNKSFLANNIDLLKNQTIKGQKKKISLNIYKNIKKYFLSKSLQKNLDISNTNINYKNDNYNSYKEQYISNKANSYRNITYVSKEKDSKNYTKRKNPKYYSNQKKIHKKKMIINKNKNRCKKGNNFEYAEFKIKKNDLVNLLNLKSNNKKIFTKKLLKRNPKSSQNYSKDIYKINKPKNENKNNEINLSRETHNSLPLNFLKNILVMNSEHFGPKQSKKNDLIKKYNINIKNIQGRNSLIECKSFKMSYPYQNITSLNKKKKIKIEDIICNKDKKINYNRNNKGEKLIKENITKKEKKEKVDGKIMNKLSDIIFKSKSKDNKVHVTKYFHKSKTNQHLCNSNKNEINFHTQIKEEKTTLENKSEENLELKNKNNPQYLSEYILDILENFLLDEASYISNNYIDPNYLSSSNNTELTEEIRVVSINWLIMIIYKIFKFKENTLFLTVQIIDRFLSKKMLSVEKTELLILCSLILCSKHEEIDYVNMVESLQLSSYKFTKEEIINMQYEILNELNFELIIPTMNDYFSIFSSILNLNDIDINKGLFLLNIILVDYHIIKYPNFLISLAAVKLIYKKSINYLIKKLRYFFTKNKQDNFLTMVKEETILDKVCKKIKKMYKSYLNEKYKNIEEKFSDEKYKSVANLSEELIDVSDLE